jgi:hypothetical protein
VASIVAVRRDPSKRAHAGSFTDNVSTDEPRDHTTPG